MVSCHSIAPSAVQDNTAEKLGLANMAVTFDDEIFATGVDEDAALANEVEAAIEEEEEEAELEDVMEVVGRLEERPPIEPEVVEAGWGAAVRRTISTTAIKHTKESS
jgi:hypothetical protein